MPSWKKLLVSGSNATIPSVSTAADFTIDAGGDIILDADGTDIVLKDGGTEFGSFKRASSDFIIKSATNDKDIVFKGVDNSATITALTLDMSEGGDAIFGGNVSGSSTSTGSFGDLIVAGNAITLGSQADSFIFLDGAGGHTYFHYNHNDVIVYILVVILQCVLKMTMLSLMVLLFPRQV